jgi:hypothetical protein
MSEGSAPIGGIEAEGLVREFKNGPRAVDDDVGEDQEDRESLSDENHAFVPLVTGR